LIGGYKENTTDGNRAGYLQFGVREGTGAKDIVERMRIASEGNVGIGTTNPDQLLHIYRATDDATLHLQAISAGDPTVKFTSPNNRKGILNFVDGSTVAQFHYNHSTTTFEFMAHNASAVDASISENVQYFAGDVGIGTNTPDSNILLHLQGETYSRAQIETTGLNSHPILFFKNDARTYDVRVAGDTDNFAIYDDTAAAYRLTINTVGNVGINTTTPQHKLHVSGDAIISGVLYDSTNSSGVAGHVFTSEVGGPQWKMIEDVLSGVGGNGTATYIPQWIDSDTIGDSVIAQSGNAIGIGTAAPVAKLEVINSTDSADTGPFVKVSNDWSSNPSDGTTYTSAVLGADLTRTFAGYLEFQSQFHQTAASRYSVIQTRSDFPDTKVAVALGINPNGGSVGIGTYKIHIR